MKKGSSGAFPMRTGGAQGFAMKSSHSFYISLLAVVVCGIGIATIELGNVPYVTVRVTDGTFWEKLFSSSPNEIGDTFAGIFGSLAFFAAAIAVVMQSFELRAQREELKLTREVMEEQKMAAQDMARSMSEQAQLYQDEQKQRQEDRAARYFDQTLIRLRNKILELRHLSEVKFPVVNTNYYDGKPDHEHAVSLLPSLDTSASIDDQIRTLADCSRVAKKTLDHLMTDHSISGKLDPILATIVLELISDMGRQVNSLSRDQQLRWLNTNLLHAEDNWKELAAMPIWEIDKATP